MFCKDCGKEIADEAVICIGCGRSVTPKRQQTLTGDQWSSGTMASLVVCSILIPLFGIIHSVININDNMASPGKKKQAQTILIVACSSMIVSGIFITGIFLLAGFSN